MIDQLTVFLENSEGRLAKLCRALADADINMKALTIADTTEYGVVRIICDDAERARDYLDQKGYRAMVTKVTAIEVPNRPGGLADLLGVLDDLDIPVEYGYCFSTAGDRAVDILKIRIASEASKAVFKLEESGFRVLTQKDL
ncbi:MAG: amino acid-binding protein [Coriobacteriaceae bacterium]|nr:MAG: amino acid-binding protein [Coriobacteriaceae bacterium]